MLINKLKPKRKNYTFDNLRPEHEVIASNELYIA